MGGIIIEYQKSKFIEPNPISEIQYNVLKGALEKDQYIKIYKQENANDLFTRYYWTLGISLGLLILCFIFGYFFGESLLLNWIGLFSAFIFLVSLYKWYLESSSFSKYLSTRNEYFLRMKFTIVKSQSFSEFNKYFYTVFSKHFDEDYNHWKKLYFKRQV